MNMRTNFRTAWGAALISATMVVHALAAPTLSVVPSSQTVQLGHSVSVSVSAGELVDLFAFQFDVAFDPLVLSATGVFEGDLLGTAGTTFFLPGLIDNSHGRISFVADTLTGPGAGASGSGVLARFEFDVLAVGVSPVIIQNPVFLDSDLVEIAVTAVAGAVEVPEPGTLLLAGMLGLISAIAAPRRFRRALNSAAGVPAPPGPAM